MLFEFYGPTPIIPETADPSDENLDYARASVDEMVGHIDQLLESLIAVNIEMTCLKRLRQEQGMIPAMTIVCTIFAKSCVLQKRQL